MSAKSVSWRALVPSASVSQTCARVALVALEVKALERQRAAVGRVVGELAERVQAEVRDLEQARAVGVDVEQVGHGTGRPAVSKKRLKLILPLAPGNVAQAGLATVSVTSAAASTYRPRNLTSNLLVAERRLPQRDPTRSAEAAQAHTGGWLALLVRWGQRCR